MTKSELIEQLADQARLPRKRAEEVVNCVLEAMTEALAQGRRIEIRGFGSFGVNDHRAYLGRNPKTGEGVPVAAKRAVHFKVGRDLRERTQDLAAGKKPPARRRMTELAADED